MRYLFLLLISLATIGAANAQEVCDNAVDDDADGLIDLNDTTDCVCNAVIGGGEVSSLIPNPSFEEYDCLPTWYSQLDCAETWSQATGSTSDYFYVGSYMPYWIDQPLPGGGNACVGGYICPDYMEYIGACLPEPMLAGTSYSINMSVAAVTQINDLADTTTNILSTIELTLWGYDQCPNWPIAAWLCPEPEGWTVLGTATYTPSGQWSTVNITFTPTYDVEAVMIGSPCVTPTDYPSVSNNALGYFLYDNLTLNQTSTTSCSLAIPTAWPRSISGTTRALRSLAARTVC
jgi:large repetitive protein